MSNWKCTGSCFCLPERLSVDDLAAVQKRLFAVRTEWYNLGLELGQHAATLDSIDATNSGDPSKCFRQVMKEWLKGIDPPPTWQAVVKALKSPTVAQGKLAEQIQTELLPTRSMAPLSPHTLSPPSQSPQPSQPHPMSSGSFKLLFNVSTCYPFRVGEAHDFTLREIIKFYV